MTKTIDISNGNGGYAVWLKVSGVVIMVLLGLVGTMFGMMYSDLSSSLDCLSTDIKDLDKTVGELSVDVRHNTWMIEEKLIPAVGATP